VGTSGDRSDLAASLGAAHNRGEKAAAVVDHVLRNSSPELGSFIIALTKWRIEEAITEWDRLNRKRKES
jgi:hypothetical protein